MATAPVSVDERAGAPRTAESRSRRGRSRCAPSSRSSCPAGTSTGPGTCTGPGHAAGDRRDELVPLRDDRVRENPAYLTVVLLARVVTRIGTIDDVHAGIIENLFASDLAFLQDLYRRVNQEGHTRAGGHLPRVRARVRRRPRRWSPGGIVTYAPDQVHEEVAYIAYHFHWALDPLLDLEHADRRRFVDEISRLNARAQRGGDGGWACGPGSEGSWSARPPRTAPLPPPPRTRTRRRTRPRVARARRCSGSSATARSPSRGSATSPGSPRDLAEPPDADRAGARTRTVGAPGDGGGDRRRGERGARSDEPVGGDAVPSSVVPRAVARPAGRRSARCGSTLRAVFRSFQAAVQRAVEPTGAGFLDGDRGGVTRASARTGASPRAERAAGRGGRRRAAAGSEPSWSASVADPAGPSGHEPSHRPSSSRAIVRRSPDSGPSATRSSDSRVTSAARPSRGAPRSSPAFRRRRRRPSAAPILGATPLQRTLADPPAPRGVPPAARCRSSPSFRTGGGPVVRDGAATAAGPRGRLPVVAGSSAGEYLQRSVATSQACPRAGDHRDPHPSTRPVPALSPSTADAGCAAPSPDPATPREYGCE